ncbi:DUF342 domain-containing protein [Paenibacillus popilliae]|uniref:DUF342 domain-containing protein n=1 Tax=Paenibacillus popilliae TaxID=78057 RepID=A0ABY3ASZ3_PAEPP|nr:FapA family protein [Paenibacillus sp. SDF0028]TQR45820.1 DUF342 domain-containing protein [Paenibacillus sp. SDF0028]
MSMTLALEEYLEVTVSEDKLQAHLHFKKAVEGLTCTIEELDELLRSYGIRYGVQSQVLKDIAANPNNFARGATMVAHGKAPVHGVDGRIELLLPQNGKESKPAEREDGTVNFREVKQLDNVKKGQMIAKRIPSQEGIPGMSVLGEEMKAIIGREARFKQGKNVVLDEAENALYSAIDGLISRIEPERISVFPVYEVNGDVDYRTGNIDFVGTIVIRGNVLTGFTVKASGDIRVYGGVEGATLTAEGCIEVSGGIIAGNKGMVKAGTHVKCSFIQEATVVAGTEVNVSQSIMHSNIRAGKRVVCQGTKGLIVGGIVQAGERVIARTIGNTMSTATVIEVGVLPDLRNELTDLRTKLKYNIENVEKTEKALRILDQLAATGQLTGEKLGMRIKLNSTKKQLVGEQTEMRERMLEIEKLLEDTAVSSIDVSHTIYGGAKLVIGRNVRFIKDMAQRISFRIVDGDIMMTTYR